MRRLIIDRSAIAENARILRERTAGETLYGVLKADGYGLGLEEMARTLLEQGVDRFAVTDPAAAVRLLREFDGLRELLLLCPVPFRGTEPLMRDRRTVFSVGSAEEAVVLARAGLRVGLRPRAHLQVDTGLGRYGFRWDDPARLRFVYERSTALRLEGVYTHFAGRESVVRRQFRRFTELTEKLRGAGVDPGLRHCCGSSALLRHPEMLLEGARAGSGLLGRVPGGAEAGLREACRCEATVTAVHALRPGDRVGYGSRFRSARKRTVAVVELGAIHGLGVEAACGRQSAGAGLRELLCQGKLLLRSGLGGTLAGQWVPVLGQLCTECCVLDVTGLDAVPGDRVSFSLNPLFARGMERIWTNGACRSGERPVA